MLVNWSLEMLSERNKLEDMRWRRPQSLPKNRAEQFNVSLGIKNIRKRNENLYPISTASEAWKEAKPLVHSHFSIEYSCCQNWTYKQEAPLRMAVRIPIWVYVSLCLWWYELFHRIANCFIKVKPVLMIFLLQIIYFELQSQCNEKGTGTKSSRW